MCAVWHAWLSTKHCVWLQIPQVIAHYTLNFTLKSAERCTVFPKLSWTLWPSEYFTPLRRTSDPNHRPGFCATSSTDHILSSCCHGNKLTCNHRWSTDPIIQFQPAVFLVCSDHQCSKCTYEHKYRWHSRLIYQIKVFFCFGFF